eukprot:7041551-Lingulodinium_polyedra.AAC.1
MSVKNTCKLFATATAMAAANSGWNAQILRPTLGIPLASFETDPVHFDLGCASGPMAGNQA